MIWLSYGNLLQNFLPEKLDSFPVSRHRYYFRMSCTPNVIVGAATCLTFLPTSHFLTLPP